MVTFRTFSSLDIKSLIVMPKLMTKNRVAETSRLQDLTCKEATNSFNQEKAHRMKFYR